MSRQKIQNIIKAFEKTNKILKSQPGKKILLTNQELDEIKNFYTNKSNITKSLIELKEFMENKYNSTNKKFSLSTLHRGLKKLNFSRRLVIPNFKLKNTPQIKNKRREVARKLLSLLYNNYNVIFIDETGCSFNVYPNYGYSKKSSKAILSSGRKSKNYTVIAGMNKWGIIGFKIFEGGICSNDFLGFLFEMIKEDLCKFNNKKICFFMDNAPIHKSKLLHKEFHKFHLTLFNAPYSPQLNPIELCFSMLKKYLKENRPKNQIDLIQKIYEGFKSIRAWHYRSFIYSLVKFIKIAIKQDNFY